MRVPPPTPPPLPAPLRPLPLPFISFKGGPSDGTGGCRPSAGHDQFLLSTQPARSLAAFQRIIIARQTLVPSSIHSLRSFATWFLLAPGGSCQAENQTVSKQQTCFFFLSALFFKEAKATKQTEMCRFVRDCVAV